MPNCGKFRYDLQVASILLHVPHAWHCAFVKEWSDGHGNVENALTAQLLSLDALYGQTGCCGNINAACAALSRCVHSISMAVEPATLI